MRPTWHGAAPALWPVSSLPRPERSQHVGRGALGTALGDALLNRDSREQKSFLWLIGDRCAGVSREWETGTAVTDGGASLNRGPSGASGSATNTIRSYHGPAHSAEDT